MSSILSGWEARLESAHPAVAYLGWLLRGAGARAIDAGGRELSAADLARLCAAAALPDAPWTLRLVSPGTAEYVVRFIGFSEPRLRTSADAAAWGWGGLASMTGEPDGPPLAPGTPLAAICAALHGFLALAAARSARLATAEIAIALGDVVASLIEVYGLRYAADGSVRGRGGDSWGQAGWGVYGCADGRVAVALRDRAQLLDLAAVLDAPALAGDRYADFLWGRCAELDEVHALLVAGMAAKTVTEVVAGLRAARIAVAPVRALDALLADAHLRGRGAFALDDGLLLPRLPLPGLPSIAEAEAFAGAATPTTRPLAGVRVVDLSTVWAGPMAARLLADLGADVVKVERPKRQIGSFSTGQAWDRDLYAILNDRNKRVLSADLQNSADRDALRELLREADVVIENFVPGSLDRLGLGHRNLHALNERLIVVAMPAAGLRGPDAAAVGYGSTIEQAAGIGWLYADADGVPHRSGINFSDPIAALYAATGAALALAGRRQNVLLEISQQEAALSLMLPALARFQARGAIPRAVAATADGAGWSYPARPAAPGARVAVRDVREVVGMPAAPGSRAIVWVDHPDGRAYPLVRLPWSGAFADAVPTHAATMPEPIAPARAATG